MADTDPSPSSSSAALACLQCGACFPSRNQLFRHVRLAHPTPNTSTNSSTNSSTSSTSTPAASSTSTGPPTAASPLSSLPAHFVYVVGGRLRGRTLNAVWRFSSARRQWEDCPAGRMLENRGSHGAATVDEVLYVVGGGGLHSNLSSCEKFDGKSWQRVAALNVSRHALAVTSVQKSVFAVGGWVDGTVCSPAAEAFDCSTGRDQWDNLPDLVVARKLHGCAALHDKLYVFGGSCDEPRWHTNTVEVLDLATVRREQQDQKIVSTTKPLVDSGNSVTEDCATSPTKKAKCSTPSVEPNLVQTKEERRLAGIKACEEGDTRRSVTESYQPYRGEAKWTVLPTLLPSKGGGASAVTVGDFIYVFLHGKRVCRFDPACDSYLELSELPVEDWHCFDVCAVIGPDGVQAEEVYVIGGASKGAWSKVAYLYNTRLDTWDQLPSMPQAKRRMACSIIMDSSA